jgi:hypothetical protein
VEPNGRYVLDWREATPDRSMFKLLGYALLHPTYAGPIGSHYLAMILMPKPVRFAAQKCTLRQCYLFYPNAVFNAFWVTAAKACSLAFGKW